MLELQFGAGPMKNIKMTEENKQIFTIIGNMLVMSGEWPGELAVITSRVNAQDTENLDTFLISATKKRSRDDEAYQLNDMTNIQSQSKSNCIVDIEKK